MSSSARPARWRRNSSPVPGGESRKLLWALPVVGGLSPSIDASVFCKTFRVARSCSTLRCACVASKNFSDSPLRKIYIPKLSKRKPAAWISIAQSYSSFFICLTLSTPSMKQLRSIGNINWRSLARRQPPFFITWSLRKSIKRAFITFGSVDIPSHRTKQRSFWSSRIHAIPILGARYLRQTSTSFEILGTLYSCSPCCK
mmetsp:Transcript_68226/g.107429  ORF Transcript_68226/g.107429 Transcript_68226/m.107429 type:complete len:200 (+) Transcript_68226:2522-3121(+)